MQFGLFQVNKQSHLWLRWAEKSWLYSIPFANRSAILCNWSNFTLSSIELVYWYSRRSVRRMQLHQSELVLSYSHRELWIQVPCFVSIRELERLSTVVAFWWCLLKEEPRAVLSLEHRNQRGSFSLTVQAQVPRRYYVQYVRLLESASSSCNQVLSFDMKFHSYYSSCVIILNCLVFL